MGTAVGVGVGPAFRRRRLWTPPSESGCKLWLSARMGVTTTAGIARWLDRSPQLHHFSQDTADDKPAVTGQALEFDRANGEFLGAAPLSGIDNGYTVGVALKLNTLPSGDNRAVFINGNGPTNGVHLMAYQTGDDKFRRQMHSAVASVHWGTPTLNPETWIARHDGAGGQADFCLNGSHQTPQALGNNVTPTTRSGIGRWTTAVTDLDGLVYAIVAYSDRKSDAIVDNLSAYLTALRDGTTLPSWRPDDETNLVLWLERPDLWAGSHVTAWANQGTAGSARDISQAITSKQMVLILGASPVGGPALHADGVDDFLRGTWTQAQPTHLFAAAVVCQSGIANASLLDGATGNSRRIFTSGTQIWAYAGLGLAVTADETQWQRLEAEYNGASSKLRVGDLTPATGNLGTAASNGLIIGVFGDQSSNPADCLITEIFEYDELKSADAQARAHAYLKAEHGV